MNVLLQDLSILSVINFLIFKSVGSGVGAD